MIRRVLRFIASLVGVGVLIVLVAGCCKCPKKPPVYLPAKPQLELPPPARPDIPRVDPAHPEVYRCFTRDGTWDLVSYLNAIRTWSENAWVKCGPAEVPGERADDK